MNLLLILLSLNMAVVYSLVDCIHGFVGRMQANINSNFLAVNETRMCAAAFCIKVLIQGAFSDDDVFQQGISSRCAYTGGDRQLCGSLTDCTPRSNYDGMKGNFSLCCCRENNCNRADDLELEDIYRGEKKKLKDQPRKLGATQNKATIDFSIIGIISVCSVLLLKS